MKKLKSAWDPVEDCPFWQARCIDNRTYMYEKMTSIWIHLETKTPYEGDESI